MHTVGTQTSLMYKTTQKASFAKIFPSLPSRTEHWKRSLKMLVKKGQFSTTLGSAGCSYAPETNLGNDGANARDNSANDVGGSANTRGRQCKGRGW